MTVCVASQDAQLLPQAYRFSGIFYLHYHKQVRASLGRSRLRVVSVTCTEVLTFFLNVIHFLGLLHETKGKQNKKSNKKTYKIHVEMKRKNRSLLKSGV